MDQAEQVLETIDYRCSRKHPSMLSADFIARLCGLRLTILDEMRLVEDHAEKVEREKSTMRATIASTRCNLIEFGEDDAIARDDKVWSRSGVGFAAQVLQITNFVTPIIYDGLEGSRLRGFSSFTFPLG